MKYRWVDRIEAWRRGRGLTVAHAVSLEEYSLGLPLGVDAVASGSLCLALAAEGAGFWVAAESEFRFWAEITSFAMLRLPGAGECGPGALWKLRLEPAGDHMLAVSGSAGGTMTYREAPIGEYFDAEERGALFRALYRERE